MIKLAKLKLFIRNLLQNPLSRRKLQALWRKSYGAKKRNRSYVDEWQSFCRPKNGVCRRKRGFAIGSYLIIAALLVLPGTTVEAARSGSRRALKLPEAANTADIVYLGRKTDPALEKKVDGLAFVHHKKSAASTKRARSYSLSQCYGFLATGSKWKSIEPWVVNPANSRGLSTDFIKNNLTQDIAKWEDGADGRLGNRRGVNILGNGTASSEFLSADEAAPDGKNEVYFSGISSSNTIAVTIVWGVFSGPIQGRYLAEWDHVYNQVDFDWSASGEAGKMDFENIATHELGHSVGLSDQYANACREQTMYGYVILGETKKRSLSPADIAGIDKLY